MRNVKLVIKHEILTTLGVPSFWLTTFVLPALLMVFSFGAQFMSTQALRDEPDILTAEPGAPDVLAIGYVDQAGLVKALPEGFPAAFIRAFPDTESAQQAMEAGELLQYYIIPEDYVQSGELLVVEQEFAPLANVGTLTLFQRLLDHNLLDDQALAQRLSEPLARVERVALDPAEAEATPEGREARFIITIGTLFIFFFVLTMSSGFMLRSVTKEKENRTVEVLLVSLRPRDLMLGKILGLGTVALLQMVIWMGGGLLILGRGDSLLGMGEAIVRSIALPPGFFIWVALYFAFGYVLYASILGAIGALAPNARETGQFTFLAMLPLMAPLWLNVAFVESPHGPVAVALSLFPLTAPTSMLPRLAGGGVPLWQPVVGIAGLAITTYIFVLLSARFFRADTLLSGASITWKRIASELKGQRA